MLYSVSAIFTIYSANKAHEIITRATVDYHSAPATWYDPMEVSIDVTSVDIENIKPAFKLSDADFKLIENHVAEAIKHEFCAFHGNYNINELWLSPE